MFNQIISDIVDIDIEIPSLVYGNLNGKEIWVVPHMHEYENIGKIKSYQTAFLFIHFLLSRFSLQHNEHAFI